MRTLKCQWVLADCMRNVRKRQYNAVYAVIYLVIVVSTNIRKTIKLACCGQYIQLFNWSIIGYNYGIQKYFLHKRTHDRFVEHAQDIRIDLS